MVGGGPAEPRPPLVPSPQFQRDPAADSPLIIQLDQRPDVIAEVNSGHYAPRIGLTVATDTETEPACGAGDGPSHPHLYPELQPTGPSGSAAWFLDGRLHSQC